MALKKLIIVGPQASGKGTQADIIAKALAIPHMSPGNLFRQEVASGSELGKQIEPYLDSGELVPTALNDAIVRKMLAENPDGLLLDGYPRNKHQAEFLDSQMEIDLVIVLDVPDTICVQRISGRRICDQGHNYNIAYLKPKQEGICDIDGLPLHMRDDDKPEAVTKRLGIYHAQTAPIIKHYEAQGKVLHFDGAPSIAEVAKAIKEKLGF